MPQLCKGGTTCTLALKSQITLQKSKITENDKTFKMQILKKHKASKKKKDKYVVSIVTITLIENIQIILALMYFFG